MKKKISYFSLLVILLVLLVIIVVVSTGAAKTNADPLITWSAVGGGGGLVESIDGSIAINGTIGQPAIGEMAVTTDGDTIELCAGFWCAWESWLEWFKVYLPLTLRE